MGGNSCELESSVTHVNSTILALVNISRFTMHATLKISVGHFKNSVGNWELRETNVDVEVTSSITHGKNRSCRRHGEGNKGDGAKQMSFGSTCVHSGTSSFDVVLLLLLLLTCI